MQQRNNIIYFLTGGVIDITGLMEIPIQMPVLTRITNFNVDFWINCLGFVLSGFLAALGAWLLQLIKDRISNKKKNDK